MVLTIVMLVFDLVRHSDKFKSGKSLEIYFRNCVMNPAEVVQTRRHGEDQLLDMILPLTLPLWRILVDVSIMTGCDSASK